MPGSSMARYFGVLRRYGRRVVLVLSHFVSRIRDGFLFLAVSLKKTAKSFVVKIRTILLRHRSLGYLYPRHSLPVRVTHWTNLVCLALLFMSGLNIFMAHPALYWGKSSYHGVPPVFEISGKQDNDKVTGVTRLFGHSFTTTGFLGASRDSTGELTVREFPSWLTIPDFRWLALARRWHFFLAWIVVLNGLSFVLYSILSGHLSRDIVPTRNDLRSIGRSILDHLRFHHSEGEEAKRYNILQKLAYLSVIFFLLPLGILMGLGMSPALDALFPGWVDLFFGRQSIRTLHFLFAWTLVLFVAIHVFEVIITGFWNNVRSMITGNYKVRRKLP
jgi:thiosulfate reductase cytochrome b subunit